MTTMRTALITVVWLCILVWPRAAAAHSNVAVPSPADLLTPAGFEQMLGAQVPLELVFRDAAGGTMRLREAIQGKPTLLVPGYYGCTNLCDVVRAGVTRAVTASGLKPGDEFNVVLISIDPREAPSDATATQRSDARARPGAEVPRWRYLVGSPAASAALAQALGFHYLFDPRTGQYAHSAGVVVVSGQGIITQYLLGVQFSPLTLRLALVGASQGRIGSIVDRLVLLCCDYDGSAGRYSLLLRRVLQGMGILTLLTVGGLILALRRAESRRPRLHCRERAL